MDEQRYVKSRSFPFHAESRHLDISFYYSDEDKRDCSLQMNMGGRGEFGGLSCVWASIIGNMILY